MVAPSAPELVTACGRCGRLFPHVDGSDPDSPAFCEPCRAAMWAADREAVAPRQCGRCRELFDGDPELHRRAQTDWWVCPECRSVLFGTAS